MAPATPAPPDQPPATGQALPRVRLELRHGRAPEGSRAASHEVTAAGFLIGSVPGCDLRLPGASLPPVFCLISRQPDGVALRKLAPVQPLLLNGQATASALLHDGDRITLGAVDLLVSITPAPGEEAATPAEARDTAADLAERERQVEEQRRELEADRVVWNERRQEIDRECRQRIELATTLSRQVQQQQQELAAARADLQTREQNLQQAQQALADRQTSAEVRARELEEQAEELAGARKELAASRQQLHDRYRQRRDRLAGYHAAIRRAGRKLQQRKHDLDAAAQELARRQDEETALQTRLSDQAEELARERQHLDARQRALDSREQNLQRALDQQRTELETQAQRLAHDQQELGRSQAEHRTDLVRLDRLEAVLDQRQKQLQQRAIEVDRRSEQLQRATRDLEEQARQLDEADARLTADREELSRQKAEQMAAGADLTQRAAAVEGQQAMLAALRTRLERMREELRQEEQQLTERSARLDGAETNLRQQVREAERLRAELEQDRQLHDQERRRFEERQAVLDEAVTQLRQAQETLAVQQEEVSRRQAEQEALAATQAEEAGLLRGRAEQLAALQERVRGEQQALRERETALAQAEKALAGLQEQLRRRSEELAARQRSLEEQMRKHEDAVAVLAAREAEAAGQRQQSDQEVTARQAAVEERGRELAVTEERLHERQQELERRAETLRRLVARVKEDGGNLDGARQALADERSRWEAEQRLRAADLDRARAEHEAARMGAVELQQQLPELEARARAAADRLGTAREQLREALGEVHAYAAESRRDLEALLAQVEAEAERVRQQELALHRTRDEHRLAVAGFRQQLIDWQSQVAELKRSLAQGESRLERRQAEVEEQVRQADVTNARLAEQAEQLQQQRRQVAERRGEVERHLEEMRAWYRRKLRELAGTEPPDDGEAAAETRPSILALTGELEPGDRQLGELLRSLELVDADTLTALLVEARRQRRSLRQLLLSGNYLTLYQVALIEAGNLDGLVLGPVRVIDRLRGTPHEVVYRVFDPRRGQEALLRHLTEAEMDDAVRPDEFRQRFAAASGVRHAHVAATWEVLEIAGRPAVLQEWLTGLPSGDWPALVAVPGVWYRLLCQATAALDAIHQAGLVHGHLHPGLVVLTAAGTLKVAGVGEPVWLLSPPAPAADEGEEQAVWEVREEVAADLAALGRLAAAWAAAGAQRKGAKGKPLPGSLQEVLRRLTTDHLEERYPTAAAVAAALEQVAADVPANAAAWERLLRQVQEQAADLTGAAA
jgi:chromosome segregation ATPase